jgi:hypothetical protein
MPSKKVGKKGGGGAKKDAGGSGAKKAGGGGAKKGDKAARGKGTQKKKGGDKLVRTKSHGRKIVDAAQKRGAMWAELTKQERQAAKLLGYATADQPEEWDEEVEEEMEELVEELQERGTLWAQLTSAQKAAAKVVGYNDAGVMIDEDDGEELLNWDEEVREAPAQKIVDEAQERGTLWAQLDPTQRAAAKVVGYNDAGLMIDEDDGEEFGKWDEDVAELLESDSDEELDSDDY